MDDYLNSERTAADFIDTQDSENNIPARCRVSPKWNPADDKEIKLEKIITQKWIALFPEGCEAWAEQRRTGYPRLYPVARTDVLTQRQWYVVSTFPVRCKPKTESNTWLLWRLWADPIMEEPDCGGIKEIIVWIKILVSECEYMYRFSYFCTFI